MVVAPDLESGCAHVERTLGVAPGPGGEHLKMGTHNRLLRLGEDVYLEVIAVNPSAPPPGRPRWFGMDHVPPAPYLATWVARCDSIDAFPLLGSPEAMSRGDLSWRLTVTADGSLACGGVAPALIEWPGRNPAHRMAEQGCSLIDLEGFHPDPEKVQSVLDAIGFRGTFSVMKGRAPSLVAHIQAARGRCKLL